jgi:hypothetical protein
MEDITGKKWQKGNYNLNILTPTWLPHNDAAQRICSKIIGQYDLRSDGAIGDRYQLVVASLLIAARQTLRSDLQDGKSIFLGCPRNNNHWSNYPRVGQKIILKVVDRLDGELIYKRQDSGQRVFYETEWGNTAYDGITTMYEVDTVLLEDNDFNIAEYIEIGREAVKVNKAESVGQREVRKRNNRSKPRYGKVEAKKAFKAPLIKHVREVEKLNTFWQQHPLELAEGSWAACATRVFHAGRLDAGGRFYGLWTGRDNVLRLKSKIDGEAVCSIDINASQPVLFSGLMGVKLKDRDSWKDLYGEIADSLNNKPDEASQVRSILKRVGMELVGTGTSSKAKPSDELVNNTGITQNQWEEYRSALIEHIPALVLMDGDHLNGAGFISYHESQMMLLSMQALMALNIPSYPVHDCLIVKTSDKDKALQVFRNTIRSYIFDHSSGRINVTVAVSVEESASKDRIPGFYL